MRPLLFLVFAGLVAGCNSTPSGPVTEQGSLASGDGTLPTGEFRDTFEVTANEGQWIRVTLASQAFDPYLIVAEPGGDQSDLDDSTPGDTTSVTMVLRAASSGSFRIVATSFRPGASGAYTLTYEVSDAEPSDGGADTADAPSAPPTGAPSSPSADAPAAPPTGGDGAIQELDGGDSGPAADAPKPSETLDA